MKVDYDQVFLSTDQPVTCPRCGSRTDIILDSHTAKQAQIHECLNTSCAFSFVVENDAEVDS